MLKMLPETFCLALTRFLQQIDARLIFVHKSRVSDFVILSRDWIMSPMFNLNKKLMQNRANNTRAAIRSLRHWGIEAKCLMIIIAMLIFVVSAEAGIAGARFLGDITYPNGKVQKNCWTYQESGDTHIVCDCTQLIGYKDGVEVVARCGNEYIYAQQQQQELQDDRGKSLTISVGSKGKVRELYINRMKVYDSKAKPLDFDDLKYMAENALRSCKLKNAFECMKYRLKVRRNG